MVSWRKAGGGEGVLPLSFLPLPPGPTAQKKERHCKALFVVPMLLLLLILGILPLSLLPRCVWPSLAAGRPDSIPAVPSAPYFPDGNPLEMLMLRLSSSCDLGASGAQSILSYCKRCLGSTQTATKNIE